jgi:ABC-2 type transport system permease protein
MTLLVFNLTLRQLLFRKSTLLLIGLAALPILAAVVFHLSSSGEDPERWTARNLYQNFVIAIVLPLTALLLGTSALGDEFEDGTAVYLLTKPIPRWQILLPKIAASWLITAAILAISTTVSGVIALEEGSKLVEGFAIAVILGSLSYCCVFALLSVATNRALVFGLVYVFLWEGVITTIFSGTRYLSIREYTVGLGGQLADTSNFVLDPTVGGTTALIMSAILIAVATYYANYRLERNEVREAT